MINTMAHLDSLNKTITELEENSKKVNNISNTLAELKTLYLQIKKINKEQKELNKKTEKVKDFFSEAMEDLFEKFEQVSYKQKEYNIYLDNKIKSLSEDNKEVLKELIVKFKEIKQEHQELNEEILNYIKVISSENTKLYMDQKKHFDNQLELTYGEIQNQNMKIKNEFMQEINNLDKNMREFKESVDTSLEGNRKRVVLNRSFLIVAILTGVLNVVISLL